MTAFISATQTSWPRLGHWRCENKCNICAFIRWFYVTYIPSMACVSCFDSQSCHIEDDDDEDHQGQEVESFEVSYSGLFQVLANCVQFWWFQTQKKNCVSDVPQEKEMMKQKLLYQQARLHRRGAPEMVLQTISVSRGTKINDSFVARWESLMRLNDVFAICNY